MDEVEWLTLKMRIDTKLRSLNPQREIIRCREGLDLSSLYCVAVEDRPTANGPADTDTGQKALDEMEDERAFDAASVERDITAPDSKRVFGELNSLVTQLNEAVAA